MTSKITPDQIKQVQEIKEALARALWEAQRPVTSWDSEALPEDIKDIQRHSAAYLLRNVLKDLCLKGDSVTIGTILEATGKYGPIAQREYRQVVNEF